MSPDPDPGGKRLRSQMRIPGKPKWSASPGFDLAWDTIGATLMLDAAVNGLDHEAHQPEISYELGSPEEELWIRHALGEQAWRLLPVMQAAQVVQLPATRARQLEGFADPAQMGAYAAEAVLPEPVVFLDFCSPHQYPSWALRQPQWDSFELLAAAAAWRAPDGGLVIAPFSAPKEGSERPGALRRSLGPIGSVFFGPRETLTEMAGSACAVLVATEDGRLVGPAHDPLSLDDALKERLQACGQRVLAALRHCERHGLRPIALGEKARRQAERNGVRFPLFA